MRSVTFAPLRRFFLAAALNSIAFVVLALFAEPAHAIPVFARKYQTSCMTCHSGFPKLNGVGLAFRMNGYRFAQEDEDKVKQPPLQLGNESYRDIFPNSILPSDIPAMPPLSVEVQQVMTTNLAFLQSNANQGQTPGVSPDFNFPTAVNIMSAGTLSKNISFWVNGGAAPGSGPSGFDPFVERAFLTVNSLFAPDAEEDENGMHLARRGLVLPKHLLNIRVGQFEPQAIAPYNSTYRALSITGRLTSTQAVGSSSFTYEPQLRGVELYGVWRNYTSWCFGVVDGAAQATPGDNNSRKDIYARLGHKWWGYPLDGEVVAAKKPKPRTKPEEDKSDDEAEDTSGARGQSPDDDDGSDPTPWVDYYRQSQFETGIFGYVGRNQVNPLTNPFLFAAGTNPNLISQDNFYRMGADFQWQHHDLHILGTYMYGQDRNPIDPGANNGNSVYSLAFNGWFVEANYYFKPWIIGYARYEEMQYVQQGVTTNNVQRAVPGVAFYPIVNMAIRTEFVIDASGKGTTPNQFLIMADYAF